MVGASVTRMLALAGYVVGASAETCCWCDADTPKTVRTRIGADSQVYNLVFSDEFNEKSRKFGNGLDKRWTALEIGDTSNKGAAFYLPEQATIQSDPQFPGVTSLLIKTENKSYVGDSPTGEKNIHMPFSSAMLQSWNKFCFTGGIVEFRARQPRGGGYWPALWLFGNLGRAVYQNSNTGLLPWSYNECDDDLELPPTDPPQRISACMDQNLARDGLHPFQGRGATEIDILEGAVTNDGKGSYVVGSLQLSPGIPPYFRPPLFGYPTEEGPGTWYTGLRWGKRGKVNNGWYGPPWGSECLTGCPDALSGGLTELDDLDTSYWTYRMEWQTGPNGGLAWYYDDEFVWAMETSAFEEYSVCEGRGGHKSCKRTPKREIPNEPMSIVMNTAIGTWNGGVTAVDGQHWPALFYIDYVRVWQGEINVGCDPPNYPTAKYIEANKGLYGEAVSPLGKDSCPDHYPPSAYAHAAAITANAAAERTRRKVAKSAAAATAATASTAAATATASTAATAAAAAATTPALMPAAQTLSALAAAEPLANAEGAAGHGFLIVSVMVAAVGALVAVGARMHKQGYFGSASRQPLMGDYQLAY